MATQQAELLPQITQGQIFGFKTSYAENVRYLAKRLFNCWHLKLSRPITRGHESYRACLRCGMHRAFDPESWTPSGPFYMPRVAKSLYQ